MAPVKAARNSVSGPPLEAWRGAGRGEQGVGRGEQGVGPRAWGAGHRAEVAHSLRIKSHRANRQVLRPCQLTILNNRLLDTPRQVLPQVS